MSRVFAIGLLVLCVGSASGAEKLPANTVLVVRATEAVDSKVVKPGQEVILVVASNLNVNGNTLVRAGAPVIAFVNEAKSSQMAGISGNISLTFRSTVAVDGQTIPLSGLMLDTGDSEVGSTVAVGVILCPLALLNKGKPGRIAPGTEVRGLTVGDYSIDYEHPIEINYMSTDFTPDETDPKKDDAVHDLSY
jgi:uncharacterized Zn-binding protein involved in type VI secretion